MSDTENGSVRTNRFDRPSENHATKNTEHAPWHKEGRHATDQSQHRRYHGLFVDLMN
jgi:hypothetical protein